MRIAILSSNRNFSGGIEAELLRRGHELEIYEHTEDGEANAYSVGRILATCDTVFCDFVQEPVSAALAYHEGRTIVRAHRIEMYHPHLAEMNWSNCDVLVFIAAHVQERFLARLTGQRPKMVVNLGHVGVDLEKFALAERTWEPPYRLLMAGNIIPKKRQYTAIQLLADMPSDTELWVIGLPMGDAGYGNGEYWQNCGDLADSLGLHGRVHYREHVPQSELISIMGQCHFVLSASNEEGCHTTVAEGMATGLVPLVNCWRGAEQMYGPAAIWRTPKQLYQRVQEWMLLSREEKMTLAAHWRQEATQFEAGAINKALADLIDGQAGAAAQAVYDAHAPHQVAQYANPRQRRCFGILMQHAASGEGTRYLDIGCGVGFVVSQAALVGMRSFGIDVSPALIKEAAYRAHDGAQYKVCDATEQLPAGPGGAWDIISLFDSLEHIPTDRRQAVIAAAYNALAQGGKLLMTFPWGGALDPMQPLEWPVYPKTVKQFTEAIGFTTEAFEALDDEYFAMVCVKGAATIAAPPEGMGAMAEGAWMPTFVESDPPSGVQIPAAGIKLSSEPGTGPPPSVDAADTPAPTCDAPALGGEPPCG